MVRTKMARPSSTRGRRMVTPAFLELGVEGIPKEKEPKNFLTFLIPPVILSEPRSNSTEKP